MYDASYKVVSLFCGAGGMDLGFIQAGFSVIWANDTDKKACETYIRNIGSHVTCGDIRDFETSAIPDCDLIIGGPPCQGFSIAGKMDFADPRSQLIWSFQEIVVEKRPRYFVMENVPAMAQLSKFEDVRNALFDKFTEAGYNIRYEILNSKDFGVAQRRKRFILIGTLEPYKKIQFPPRLNKEVTTREAISDLDKPGTGNNTGMCNAKITVAQYPVLRKSPYAGMLFNGLGRPIDLDRPCQTLPASMGGNKTPIVEENLLKNTDSESWVKKHHALVASGAEFNAYEIDVPDYLRRITVREAARIQGFNDSFLFHGNTGDQFKQIGNSVPPPLAYYIALAVKASLNDVNLRTDKQALLL